MTLYTRKNTSPDEVDLYVGCDCHDPSHAVKFTKYNNEEYLYVAFNVEHDSLWARIKYACRMIFKGYNNTNDVLLDKKTWASLGGILLQTSLQLNKLEDGDTGMPKKILNLTSRSASPSQIDAGVFEPHNKDIVRTLNKFDEPPTNDEMISRARKLAEICRDHDMEYAMIGGEGYFMSVLESVLAEDGIRALHSFSKLVEEETTDENGVVNNISKLIHSGWVK